MERGWDWARKRERERERERLMEGGRLKQFIISSYSSLSLSLCLPLSHSHPLSMFL
jgi:hypothetical protein